MCLKKHKRFGFMTLLPFEEKPLYSMDLRLVCFEHRKWYEETTKNLYTSNPLSPSVHIQILQTVLHKFPKRIS